LQRYHSQTDLGLLDPLTINIGIYKEAYCFCTRSRKIQVQNCLLFNNQTQNEQMQTTSGSFWILFIMQPTVLNPVHYEIDRFESCSLCNRPFVLPDCFRFYPTCFMFFFMLTEGTTEYVEFLILFLYFNGSKDTKKFIII
jgi:hypothetical protein